ncbi:MAG: ThiF family adenylyltransferase [Planctomycetota bacterium]
MTTEPTVPEVPERYARQARLPQVGPSGQKRLAEASVAIVGVGATGSALAPLIVRAGFGRVRLIDRDIVERSNLQRQLLYTDQDAERALPKVEAAQRALAAANPEVTIEAHAADLSAGNVHRLLDGVDLVLDGTDNFEARLLLNDWCVRERVPWIYVGVIGVTGHTLTILPGSGPCFRCYLPEPPPPGTVATCETAGVLGPAVTAIASLAATEAIKICTGQQEALRGGLLVLDAWRHEVRTLGLTQDAGCPCCVARDFSWLQAGQRQGAEALCGRDSVLVRPAGRGAQEARVDLGELARRLEGLPDVAVRQSAVALRVAASGLEATVFPDGRAIVRGTREAGRARSFYARYLS